MSYIPRASSFVVFILIPLSLAVWLQGCATKPAATQAEADIEPIPLDSTDPRYDGYLALVRSMIKEKWRYPCVWNQSTSRCEYPSARLVLMFDILKNGRVARVVVASSSGYEAYDQHAADAIGLASPFPLLPPELISSAAPGFERIRIVASFRYEQSKDRPEDAGAGATTKEPRPIELRPEAASRFAGEPVRLNSLDLDPKSRDYLARVSQMIRNKWSYPCVRDEATRRCDHKATKLTVEFGLLADGQVAFVTVTERAEWGVYDQYAVDAINAAAPFPPVPPELLVRAGPGSAGVRILSTFHYVIDMWYSR